MSFHDEVLEIFTQINQTPRGSGNETAISNWLVNLAKQHGWEVVQDEALNIIITVPGTKEQANADTVILQGHMDMVCVKDANSNHDFTTDPIEMYTEGEWLKAKGTTLGADNGIALAIALAIAKNAEHPPLQLLFTTDEERGLTGAKMLKGDVLKGKYLINIDSEDEGVFTIGCAGGRDTHIKLPLSFESNTTLLPTYEFSVAGLSGGHSGIQIGEQKANAIQIASRFLQQLSQGNEPIYISNIQGGIAHNAIPTSTTATFCFNNNNLLDTVKNQMFAIFEREHRTAEPAMLITLKQTTPCTQYLNATNTEKIINLLMALPHGVFTTSKQPPHLVETSNNLAQIDIDEGALNILLSQRSSSLPSLEFITKKIEAVAQLAGATFFTSTGYPAWEPEWQSSLLTKAVQVYKQLFGKDPRIEVIHAGLECGVLGAKYPQMQMLSIGPTIHSPHTTNERLKVTDIDKIGQFLKELLKQL